MRPHRAIDCLHQLRVDGEPQIGARDGRLLHGSIEQALRFRTGSIATVRIDDALLPATLPAKVALPCALEAGRPARISALVVERVDLRALLRAHFLETVRLHLSAHLGFDLADVANRMRAEVLVRLGPNGD